MAPLVFQVAMVVQAALVVLEVVDLALYVLYNTYRQGKLDGRIRHDKPTDGSANHDSVFRV